MGVEAAGKRGGAHSAGVNRMRALHFVARAASPDGRLAASRSYFLSNGASAHHWQHRVFPDGDVLEPLIDDASEVPERAAGTRYAEAWARDTHQPLRR